VSRNRIVRADVRHENELEALWFKAVEIAREHGRNIAIGVGVVALAVAAILLVQRGQAGAESVASTQVSLATRDIEANQIDAAAARLTDVVSRHGGTPSGNRARFFLGELELRRGNAAAAEAQFQAFLGKVGSSDYFWAAGQRGRGVALENQGKHAEAATAYESVVKGNISDDERARALLDAARARRLGGDSAASLALAERVIAEYPATRSIGAARTLKAELAVGR
jgi:predicted negative regulator of RcsB-dependent stress response